MNVPHSRIIAICTLLLCSCSNEIIYPENDKETNDDYVIPIDEALNSLDDFFISCGESETKGLTSARIDNYFTITSPAATKSSATVHSSDLIYAVNFKDDNGYALLAADRRINEDILAITEKGSVTKDDFSQDYDNLTPSEEDDLSENEYNEMVESGVLALINRKINDGCLKYAEDKVANSIKDGDYTPSNGGTSNRITYWWEVEKEVPMLLETVWTQEGQHNIFNKYCPKVGIKQRIAPAGCVCIAVSQIMAYHEFPSNLICNKQEIDYSEIKKIYRFDDRYALGDSLSQEMLAKYIVNVGNFCNTKYHCMFGQTWGFAWPSGAKECLSKMGYQNVDFKWGYDEERVISALDKRCPVFMSAVAKAFSGHGWVIDGYKKRKYVSSQGTVINRQTLVHCNWGWGGLCNGYFTSGVFKINSAEIYDGFGKAAKEEHYWHAFNTITYDKPEK